MARRSAQDKEIGFAAAVVLVWAASMTVACTAPVSAPGYGSNRLFHGEGEPISSTQSPRRQGQILFGNAREGTPTGQIEVNLQAAVARSVQAVAAKTSDDVSYFEVFLSTSGNESTEDMFSATVSGDSTSFTIKAIEAGESTISVGAFDEDGNNITKDDWVTQTVEVAEGSTAEVSLQLELADGSSTDGGKIKTSVTVKDGVVASKPTPSLETEE